MKKAKLNTLYRIKIDTRQFGGNCLYLTSADTEERCHNQIVINDNDIIMLFDKEEHKIKIYVVNTNKVYTHAMPFFWNDVPGLLIEI